MPPGAQASPATVSDVGVAGGWLPPAAQPGEAGTTSNATAVATASMRRARVVTDPPCTSTSVESKCRNRMEEARKLWSRCRRDRDRQVANGLQVDEGSEIEGDAGAVFD